MKNMIMMIVGIAIGALTFLTILTIAGRMNYSSELKSQMSAAMEDTFYNAMVKQEYSISDENEFLADVTENLMTALDAKTDITLRVMWNDIEKGLFSMEAVRDFFHPNGKNGMVKDHRTVLLEKVQKPEAKWFTVKFFTDMESGKCYKQYEVSEGERITAPVEPKEQGKKFAGWQDSDGYMADFSQPVEQDQNYYAIWE